MVETYWTVMARAWPVELSFMIASKLLDEDRFDELERSLLAVQCDQWTC